MPKTFILRAQLTRSYDTLLGDLKSRDEDLLHRKHVGENDTDFDGLEPEEDFEVPLQRKQQHEPLDLVKQKQAAKQLFLAPGSASSAFDWTRPLAWSAAQQARLQAEKVEAVSRRLREARVRETGQQEAREEQPEEETIDVTAVSEEEEDEEDQEEQEQAVSEPAVRQPAEEEPEEPEPAQLTTAAEDGPVDLSVGAHPLRCFPCLAPPSRRTTVIAHTTTVPKKRPYYRRNLLPGGKFHLDSPPPAPGRPKDLRGPRAGLAPVQAPLGSGNNPLSPTPGYPYGGGGTSDRGGGGSRGQGDGGVGPPGYGGLFGPSSGGNFGFGLMNCKTAAGDAGGGSQQSPRYYQPPQAALMENFRGGCIDQQVESCKPPPQPPPAQWALQAQTGPRMPPVGFDYGSDPFPTFSDPYEQLDAELFGNNPGGEGKPAVSAASLTDGGPGEQLLQNLEQLLQQPAAAAVELSQQTVAEALGGPASLPTVSGPAISSCLANDMYDGKLVVTTGQSCGPPPPPVQPPQLPESTSAAPSRCSPGPVRGGRCSPRSPRPAWGDSADCSPGLDARVSMLQQRLGLPETHTFEFVNGDHGIKNPHANERTFEVEKLPPIICEDDPKTYMCRLCSKKFTLLRLLNRHMKCHSDVKRYLCTFCCKGFNDTFDLKRHTRTHTGVRPYRCMLCEKSFTQRCSLESHCLKVHGVHHQYNYKQRRNKVYVCEECGATSLEPEAHYLHLKERHPNSPALLKFYDKRHFKFNADFSSVMLQSRS